MGRESSVLQVHEDGQGSRWMRMGRESSDLQVDEDGQGVISSPGR